MTGRKSALIPKLPTLPPNPSRKEIPEPNETDRPPSPKLISSSVPVALRSRRTSPASKVT